MEPKSKLNSAESSAIMSRRVLNFGRVPVSLDLDLGEIKGLPADDVRGRRATEIISGQVAGEVNNGRYKNLQRRGIFTAWTATSTGRFGPVPCAPGAGRSFLPCNSMALRCFVEADCIGKIPEVVDLQNARKSGLVISDPFLRQGKRRQDSSM